MAQLQKYLPWKHEDLILSLEPAFLKKPGVMAHACNPSRGNGDRQVYGAHYLVSLAELLSSRPVRSLVSEKKNGLG